jgi:hypothetical protein
VARGTSECRSSIPDLSQQLVIGSYPDTLAAGADLARWQLTQIVRATLLLTPFDHKYFS